MANGVGPLAIVNDILLDGMREVGDLVASGEMQLPFVATERRDHEVSVAYLEPLMEKERSGWSRTGGAGYG